MRLTLKSMSITMAFLVLSYIKALAQYDSPNYTDIKGLSLGYSYSFDGKEKSKYHLLDVQFNKGRFGGHHPGGFIYGFGTEILLNANRFTLGPKIGAHMFLGIFSIGSELVTYTDFDNWTLRYVFSIGFGIPKARFTINPQVILTNEDYRPIHKGYINFTWNFFLDKKDREIK